MQQLTGQKKGEKALPFAKFYGQIHLSEFWIQKTIKYKFQNLTFVDVYMESPNFE